MTEWHISFPCDLYVIMHLNNSTFSREGKEEKYFSGRGNILIYYKYLLNTTTVFPVSFKIIGILWMFSHIGKFTWRRTDIIRSPLDGFHKRPKAFKPCLGGSFSSRCIISTLKFGVLKNNNCFITFHDSGFCGLTQLSSEVFCSVGRQLGLLSSGGSVGL